MRIRRIEIKNFKKLVDPVVIEGLGDGTTVIAGDNEEGKSTVLQALRSVLFDRHNLTGEAAEAMQPFGHRVRPEIALDFEIGGALFRLSKGFCQRPSAELRMSSGTLSGQAVEDKLQELLRFHPPGRGQGRPDEHHGVYGMFWVEQGKAFDPISLSSENRGTLTGALEGEVGQILGGARGRALKDAISRQYSTFFTDTGRARGAHADAVASVDQMEAQLRDLKQQLSQYDGKVDDLSRARERLAAHERESRLARAQAAFDQAQAGMIRLESLRRSVQDTRATKVLADANIQAPVAAQKRREDAIARVEKEQRALSAARVAQQSVDATIASQTGEVGTLAEAFREAERAFNDAAQDIARLQAAAERKRLTADVVRLAHALAEAEAASERARAASAAARAIAIDSDALRRLRSLEHKKIEANAALAGSATLLQFQLDTEGTVRIAGKTVERSEKLLIAEPTEIAIENIGSLSVTPGGTDLSARRDTAARATAAAAELLGQLGAVSLAEAETLFEQRKSQTSEQEQQNRIVAAHAPEGIEALRTALAIARASLERCPVAEAPDDEGDLDVLRASHRFTERALSEARSRHEASSRELAKSREDGARALATLDAAQAAASEADRELAGARSQTTDEALQAAVETAGANLATATAALQAAEQALGAADPEASQLAFEQARDGLKNIQHDIESLERHAETTAAELRAVGQQGLGEAVQEVEGKLALAVSKRDRLMREAATLKLLYTTLIAAERRGREAFLAPVQSRVQPYLRLLLPDTQLVLSDSDLGVTHIRRAGQDEPFGSLSVGAREQIAVLTRLAFADLLRERGVEAPVVLDDALVNSDPRRFERMLLAIRRAAKGLQIIVLTCREADWIQAGAPVIRLSDCVSK